MFFQLQPSSVIKYCFLQFIIFLILIILIILSLNVSAQDSKITFNYREYNPKNDFYGRNIGAFYQDGFGFMWFGCEGGLYRHDGNRIKQMVNFEDTLGYSGVRGPVIQHIIEGDSGYFWFGYKNYLIQFNPELRKYYTLARRLE